MDLDRVLAALQSTLERADRRLKARAEGDLQYAVTDFRIDLPAEVRVEANGRTVVRFPRRRDGEEPPIPESHLSRLVFSLKPVLTLDREP
ncbi:MAG: hypothetical protein ACE5HA_11945 [Anaerolineae bacterium]